MPRQGAHLIPTALKRWRKLKRGEHSKLIVVVGGEPAILQQYYREEGTDHHQVTEGRGQWLDIPLEEGLLP